MIHITEKILFVSRRDTRPTKKLLINHYTLWYVFEGKNVTEMRFGDKTFQRENTVPAHDPKVQQTRKFVRAP